MKSKINRTSSLTKRQEQVLPILLSSPSYEEAARQAKVSPKQIYEWLKNDLFKQELTKRRHEMFCEALALLKSSVMNATESLISLLNTSDERLKMQVADKLINNAFKSAELLDFEERISHIEKRIEEKEVS
jgi:DNA-binding CsgD family transcriptional regulator